MAVAPSLSPVMLKVRLPLVPYKGAGTKVWAIAPTVVKMSEAGMRMCSGWSMTLSCVLLAVLGQPKRMIPLDHDTLMS